jgi:cysteinyl-tRNA synthetase
MQTHYGKQMNFTFDSLKAAEEGLNHLYNQIRELRITNYELRIDNIDETYKSKFIMAINDDLNMPQALAVLQEVLKSELDDEIKYNTVMEFDKVLGLKFNEALAPVDLPSEVNDLVKAREQVRIDKNFDESDRLRGEIEKLGYTVEDTKDGQRVYKK